MGLVVCWLAALPGSVVEGGSQSESAASSEEHLSRGSSVLSTEKERHLTNIRQLTFGNKNAEAYFSFEGNKLVFQSTSNWSGPTSSAEKPGDAPPHECYQIYVMDLETSTVRRASSGRGATTCGYFFPGGRRILYSSTHLKGAQCPPKPKIEGRYRWALDDYDIYTVRLDGTQIQRMTATPGYDAEATISPDSRTIVFTSIRNGDLDLYAMDLDGQHVRRLTHEVGYDGGAFFSPDSRRIVYRAFHPQDAQTVTAYQELLAQNLVEPNRLELFIMNADGSDQRQVTTNGASNFAPFFHPDGQRIIFSSNVHAIPSATNTQPPTSDHRPTFHLYLIGDDGTGLEQITTEGRFNSFPMFSPDGKQLVWISDRGTTQPGEFNIFLADWVP